MSEIMLHIENVSKQYRLGQIGGTTLRDELQRLSAKIRGKEDPTKKVGAKDYNRGETFMALDGVSFDVKKGERVGIIGHNGAGKSTLLKLISRVTAPTSGRIGLNGRVASMLEVGTGFHPELTGRENIYMNGAILGMTKKEIDKKVEDIIDFSECRQFIDTPVKRYSSGMYVKLAFSVAAHLDSEIMVMDEVLAVGDMAFQNKCLNKMSDVSMTEGRTILYVSHNMNTIQRLCDRCIVLDHGKVVLDGDVGNGIQAYLDIRSEEEKTWYSLSETKRPFPMHGVKLHINSIEFMEIKKPTYDRKEPVSLKIVWEAHEHIDDLRFLFSIHSIDGSNVAAIESEIVGNAEVGKKYSSKLEMDISCLAEGKYYFVIDMYTVNAYGVHHSYDHPMQNIYFEVLNTEPYSIIWQPQYWGRIRMQRMKCTTNTNIV